MTKTDKATAIIKLLKKGYSPIEITRRINASYNYAWKLKKELEKAAATEQEAETLTEAVKAKISVEVEAAESAQADTSVNAILNQRASTYGSFMDHATITYQLKQTAHQFTAEKGKSFEYDQCEALDMIFSKIGRILNGDPNHLDSWVDIAGYAQLVADRLQGKVR